MKRFNRIMALVMLFSFLCQPTAALAGPFKKWSDLGANPNKMTRYGKYWYYLLGYKPDKQEGVLISVGTLTDYVAMRAADKTIKNVDRGTTSDEAEMIESRLLAKSNCTGLPEGIRKTNTYGWWTGTRESREQAIAGTKDTEVVDIGYYIQSDGSVGEADVTSPLRDYAIKAAKCRGVYTIDTSNIMFFAPADEKYMARGRIYTDADDAHFYKIVYKNADLAAPVLGGGALTLDTNGTSSWYGTSKGDGIFGMLGAPGAQAEGYIAADTSKNTVLLGGGEAGTYSGENKQLYIGSTLGKGNYYMMGTEYAELSGLTYKNGYLTAMSLGSSPQYTDASNVVTLKNGFELSLGYTTYNQPFTVEAGSGTNKIIAYDNYDATTINNKLSINGDTEIQKLLYVTGDMSVNNANVTANRLIVGGDTTLGNSTVEVGSLVKDGDLSLNNVDFKGNIEPMNGYTSNAIEMSGTNKIESNISGNDVITVNGGETTFVSGSTVPNTLKIKNGTLNADARSLLTKEEIYMDNGTLNFTGGGILNANIRSDTHSSQYTGKVTVNQLGDVKFSDVNKAKIQAKELEVLNGSVKANKLDVEKIVNDFEDGIVLYGTNAEVGTTAHQTEIVNGPRGTGRLAVDGGNATIYGTLKEDAIVKNTDDSLNFWKISGLQGNIENNGTVTLSTQRYYSNNILGNYTINGGKIDVLANNILYSNKETVYANANNLKGDITLVNGAILQLTGGKLTEDIGQRRDASEYEYESVVIGAVNPEDSASVEIGYGTKIKNYVGVTIDSNATLKADARAFDGDCYSIKNYGTLQLEGGTLTRSISCDDRSDPRDKCDVILLGTVRPTLSITNQDIFVTPSGALTIYKGSDGDYSWINNTDRITLQPYGLLDMRDGYINTLSASVLSSDPDAQGNTGKLSFDVKNGSSGITNDQIKLSGGAYGMFGLESVSVKGDLDNGSKFELINGGNLDSLMINGTSSTYNGKTYTFTQDPTDKGWIDVAMDTGGTLCDVIQNRGGYGKVSTYTFAADETMTEDLGTLTRVDDNTPRVLTIDGNSRTLTANGRDGVTINSGDTLNVRDLTVSGYSTFATNSGTMSLDKVKFTSSGAYDVVNEGTLNLNNNASTFNKGISGNGTTNINVDTDMGSALLMQNNVNVASGNTLTIGADKLQSPVTNKGTVKLNAGILGSYKIEGGKIETTEDGVEASADNLKSTRGITNEHALAVNGGTLTDDILGAGTVNFTGTVTNSAVIENKITNSGTFTNSGIVNGTVTNNSSKSFTNSAIVNGEVTNDGEFANKGIITKTVTNNSSFTNDGILAAVTNNGTFANNGLITDAVTNNIGGTFKSEYLLLEKGITNNGTLETSGEIAKAITGTGTVTLVDNATLGANVTNQDITVNAGKTLTANTATSYLTDSTSNIALEDGAKLDMHDDAMDNSTLALKNFTATGSAKLSFDTKLSDLTNDKITVAGMASGALTLDEIYVKDQLAGDLGTTKQITLIGGDASALNITGTAAQLGAFKYTFTQNASNKGDLDVTKEIGCTLPEIIQLKKAGAQDIATYTLEDNLSIDEDLGSMKRLSVETPRTFSINGNGNKTLSANGYGGLAMNYADTLNLKDITIADFGGFAASRGTINLDGVTFKNSGLYDIANYGTLNINGAGVTLSAGIAGEGTTNINVDTDFGKAYLMQDTAVLAAGKTMTIDAYNLRAYVENNGTVKLGAGELKEGSVISGGKVETLGDVTASADSLQTTEGIVNKNTITLTNGELTDIITDEGTGTGKTIISGYVESKADITNDVTVNGTFDYGAGTITGKLTNNLGLILEGSTITGDVTNNGDIMVLGNNKMKSLTNKSGSSVNFVLDAIPQDSTAIEITGTEAVDMAKTNFSLIQQEDLAYEKGKGATLISKASNYDGTKDNPVVMHITKTDPMSETEYAYNTYLEGEAFKVDAGMEDPKVKLREETKSFSEGRMAITTALTQANDTVTNLAITAGVEASSAGAGFQPFASVGGSHGRYNTGSYVDMNGFNAAVGLAKKVTDNTTVGLLVEGGHGNYTAHNDFASGEVVADGDVNFFGGGVFAKHDFKATDKGNLYVDGSFRIGHASQDYDSITMYPGVPMRYDASGMYMSAHASLGYNWKFGKGQTLDTYARYLWSRQNSDNVEIDGIIPMEFDAITSRRIRAGFRYNKEINKALKWYGGLAWEYEFSNNAAASFSGLAIAEPDLKGSSGIAELGIKYNPKKSNWKYDFSLQGTTGKRDSIAVQLGAMYEF